jgi:hypothetical protein
MYACPTELFLKYSPIPEEVRKKIKATGVSKCPGNSDSSIVLLIGQFTWFCHSISINDITFKLMRVALN